MTTYNEKLDWTERDIPLLALKCKDIIEDCMKDDATLFGMNPLDLCADNLPKVPLALLKKALDSDIIPTYKSPAIESLLTNVSGISRQDAAKQSICTWCKSPISQFRDKLSRKEYGISGLCQSCQDQVFGSGDED